MPQITKKKEKIKKDKRQTKAKTGRWRSLPEANQIQRHEARVQVDGGNVPHVLQLHVHTTTTNQTKQQKLVQLPSLPFPFQTWERE